MDDFSPDTDEFLGLTHRRRPLTDVVSTDEMPAKRAGHKPRRCFLDVRKGGA